MSELIMAITRKCCECSEENELPFLFCEQCNAPRFQVGKFRVFFHIILISLVFFGIYFIEDHEDLRYYAEDFLVWSWPIYLLYGYLFLVFAIKLVAGKWGLALRHAIWYLGFILLFLVYFELDHRMNQVPGVSSGIITELIAQGPEAAADHPVLFFSILGGLVLIVFVPCYIHWGRKYGWINAYRIVLISLISIGLILSLYFWGAIRILKTDSLAFLHEQLRPLENSWDGYWVPLTVFISRMSLILLMEIMIFSALKGYGRAHRKSFGLRKSGLEKEGAFVKSLMLFGIALRRLILTFENMLAYLLEILRQLMGQVMAVFLAFVREILIPVLMLSITAVLLYNTTMQTREYIDQSNTMAMFRIITNVALILLSMMIFMTCKTSFRITRIFQFYFELIGWLLPNLIVCSLLISLFLFGSSYMADRMFGYEESHFPFRIGPITMVLLGMLIALVVYLLVAKRSLFRFLHEEELKEAASAGGGVPSGTDTGRESRTVRMRSFFRRRVENVSEKHPGLIRQARNLVQNVAEKKNEIASELKAKLEGRPPIVDRLTRVCGLLEEKNRELEILKKSRNSISGEVFSKLLNKRERELQALIFERDHVQTELNTMWAKKNEEKARHTDHLSDVNYQIAELEKLNEVGALKELELKLQLKPLQAERQDLQVYIDACNEVLVFLEPASTARRDNW
jgi:hypothetical protein